MLKQNCNELSQHYNHCFFLFRWCGYESSVSYLQRDLNLDNQSLGVLKVRKFYLLKSKIQNLPWRFIIFGCLLSFSWQNVCNAMLTASIKTAKSMPCLWVWMVCLECRYLSLWCWNLTFGKDFGRRRRHHDTLHNLSTEKEQLWTEQVWRLWQ